MSLVAPPRCAVNAAKPCSVCWYCIQARAARRCADCGHFHESLACGYVLLRVRGRVTDVCECTSTRLDGDQFTDADVPF